MNKKPLIIIISLMVTAIVAAVVFMFIHSLDNPKIQAPDETESTQDTPVVPDDTPDVPENTEDTTDTPDVPENTADTPDVSENTQDTPDTTENESTADSGYDSLTLLKGMSAEQAYEYLDSFLNSAYGILLNKSNKVGSDYVPDGLVTVQGYDYKMERKAANALINMLNDAKADGITDLVLYSGYRSYATQKNKFDTRTQKYLNQGYSQQDAENKAGEYIAPPGASEHHTGLAADVCSYASVAQYGYLSDTFDQTKEFKWLNEHCAEYGFILRYKKEAEDITGYSYEPWHFRYIGVEHAKACTELGITYEEYYELLVKYRDEAKALMNKSE